MQIVNSDPPQGLELRPAVIFAFIRVCPLLLCTVGLLFLAWWLYPGLIWLSIAMLAMASYRYFYIRKIRYLVTSDIIRTRRGIFFKRVDQVELYRIKDYILTQSFLLQLFRLMDLELRSTDPVNPVIWLRGIPVSDLVDTIRAHVQEARQHNRIYEIN